LSYPELMESGVLVPALKRRKSEGEAKEKRNRYRDTCLILNQGSLSRIGCNRKVKKKPGM